MDGGNNKLFIGGGPTGYSVSLQVGDDDFYNLTSDPSVSGWKTVTLGGQFVDWPRRLLVSRNQATVAARGFLAAGDAVLEDGKWEPSGPELEPAR